MHCLLLYKERCLVQQRFVTAVAQHNLQSVSHPCDITCTPQAARCANLMTPLTAVTICQVGQHEGVTIYALPYSLFCGVSECAAVCVEL
jgi:hypothetical protein